MELFSLLKFIEYKLFARHRKGHGIHSPFIFNLVSEVFQNKSDPEIVYKIEAIRKEMLNDKRMISVNDLGSGSGRMKNGLRSVSDITRNSAVSKKYGRLLFNLASAFAKSDVIEFGTSFGFSAMYMASSSPGSHIYTMEGCRNTSEIAAGNFVKAGLGNITLITGPFEDSVQTLINRHLKPGLVFIDGNHRRDPTISYFEKVVGISDNDTVVVIDDIYYSAEMAEAWKVIRLNPGVTATIDIYRMGIVFFRKGLNYINYVIRY